MINNLKDEIRNEILKETKYVSEHRVDTNLIYLLALKYYCDKSLLSYEQLIKETTEENINIEEDFIITKSDKLRILKLLPLIQYENLQELVKDYLKTNKIGINLIDNSHKKICLCNRIKKFIYDMTGNTTYIIDKFDLDKEEIIIFQFFDKALNLDNKYSKYEDIIFENYHYVYIYDDTPKYRFIKENSNDIYPLIRQILKKNNDLKIILHTDYKKISNIKQSRLIMKYMSKVLLDEETAFIFYEKKDNNKVSIINYNKDKIYSFDKLLQIIDNDRKQKDILVKTTTEDIINNHYRIGFKLYQSSIIEKARNINEIVDENTKLIEELSTINKRIEQEINKLINR